MAVHLRAGGIVMNVQTRTPTNVLPDNLAELHDDPYAWYPRILEHGSVFHLEALNACWVFGYREVLDVLRDPTTFSSDVGRFAQGSGWSVSASLIGANTVVGVDPPRHSRLRELVNCAFTPRRITALEPTIEALAWKLLDAVVDRGEMDVVDDLATPLPVIVIASLLGIPPEDREQFKRWSDLLIANLGRGVLGASGPPPGFQQANDELMAYLRQQIERRRQRPGDDLISALIDADVDGHRLSEPELLAFCRLLLVAGNGTTTHLIGNAIRCLLEAPGIMDRVRQDLSLVPGCVEEALRFRSPVQSTRRWATRDTTLGGEEIRDGQLVLVWLGAANRDPSVFPDPDRFDPARHPNPHLAFAQGPHFCLGAPLARLEAGIALTALLGCLADLRRADDLPLEPSDGPLIHGVKHLPVRFTPGYAAPSRAAR
jgi:cytochrome P450